MTKQLLGTVSIGRYSTGGSRGGACYIEITDGLSGVRFLRIELSAEELGLALTGLSMRPCMFEHFPELVGKRREFKDEHITLPEGYNYQRRREIITELADVFQVDSWEHQISKSSRHDNIAKRGQPETVSVSFVRFVDVDTE